MIMLLIAGLLVVFPALVVMLWFIGRPIFWPAAASFAINLLPFLVAIWIISKMKRKGHEMEDAH